MKININLIEKIFRNRLFWILTPTLLLIAFFTFFTRGEPRAILFLFTHFSIVLLSIPSALAHLLGLDLLFIDNWPIIFGYYLLIGPIYIIFLIKLKKLSRLYLLTIGFFLLVIFLLNFAGCVRPTFLEFAP